MKAIHTKIRQALLIGALLGVQPIAATLRAEDTNAVVIPAVTVGADSVNAVELIKQLQKRIEELEQKVNALEGGKPTNAVAGDAKAKQQINELDQKVKVLEREKELEQETLEAKAKEAPKISIGAEGFSFASANKDFAVQLKGILQVDSRTYFDNPSTTSNDGLLLRRVRPILQGTVFRDFDFLFVPDFQKHVFSKKAAAEKTYFVWDAAQSKEHLFLFRYAGSSRCALLSGRQAFPPALSPANRFFHSFAPHQAQ